MSKISRAARAVALIAAILVVAAAWPSTATGKRAGYYEPPYRNGGEGGDYANIIHADRETGDIRIFRAFPWPGVFGCNPESLAGWANFKVVHRVTKPPKAVVVSFEDTLMDAYSFLTVSVTGPGDRFLGAQSVQGPRVGESGAIAARIEGAVRSGDEITIAFGVQLSSACPQAGAAGARFPAVSVKT